LPVPAKATQTQSRAPANYLDAEWRETDEKFRSLIDREWTRDDTQWVWEALRTPFSFDKFKTLPSNPQVAPLLKKFAELKHDWEKTKDWGDAQAGLRNLRDGVSLGREQWAAVQKLHGYDPKGYHHNYLEMEWDAGERERTNDEAKKKLFSYLNNTLIPAAQPIVGPPLRPGGA
jgi:hypothetical protein